MLTSERVRLRAPERTDLPTFVKWFNDPEVTEFLLRRPPMGMEEEERWFDDLVRDYGKVFCIETLDGRLIGNLGIVHIDWTNRKADIGIVLGEKEYWSRGYGTEAITLLLGYMFEELNLHRIWLYCEEENRRAQRCYEKCGFQKEGTFRHNRKKEGKYINDILYSILREDWDAMRRKGTEG